MTTAGKIAAVALAMALGASGPALAKDKGHGNGNGNAGHGDHSGPPAGKKPGKPAVVVIEPRHRTAVFDWFGGHHGYYRPLPPGIARKLARGGTLPPGHYDKVPAGVIALLPAAPSGHVYYMVGSDVVLAAIATGIIVDIISDVIR